MGFEDIIFMIIVCFNLVVRIMVLEVGFWIVICVFKFVSYVVFGRYFNFFSGLVFYLLIEDKGDIYFIVFKRLNKLCNVRIVFEIE